MTIACWIEMFLEIAKVYLQGLGLASITVILVGIIWVFWRAKKNIDKTARERQSVLYDVLLIALMTAPILAFAFVAIILMIKA
ncbi:hypothetical protein RDF_0299 [Streptococcus agalactiae]|nr:hypothetical protein SaSA20_0265 [Streptococcus agalactiae]EAO62504.1 conserved hypothetical protein [Streptococcus agalactiae 18RS21]EAO70625.1 conserved hypothetical protein [Streptococcus agalactiae 515]EAO74251.1 conserved hypothetical protein [Streptococcus agalactiae CJB111]EAO79149.1 conserved hypothetical protein [Streptococcus agalactiae H36B]